MRAPSACGVRDEQIKNSTFNQRKIRHLYSGNLADTVPRTHSEQLGVGCWCLVEQQGGVRQTETLGEALKG